MREFEAQRHGAGGRKPLAEGADAVGTSGPFINHKAVIEPQARAADEGDVEAVLAVHRRHQNGSPARRGVAHGDGGLRVIIIPIEVELRVDAGVRRRTGERAVAPKFAAHARFGVGEIGKQLARFEGKLVVGKPGGERASGFVTHVYAVSCEFFPQSIQDRHRAGGRTSVVAQERGLVVGHWPDHRHRAQELRVERQGAVVFE